MDACLFAREMPPLKRKRGNESTSQSGSRRLRGRPTAQAAVTPATVASSPPRSLASAASSASASTEKTDATAAAAAAVSAGLTAGLSASGTGFRRRDRPCGSSRGSGRGGAGGLGRVVLAPELATCGDGVRRRGGPRGSGCGGGRGGGCGLGRAALTDEPAASGAGVGETGGQDVCAGAEVVLVGLRARPELNGERGLVRHQVGDRWFVSLSCRQELVRVLPQNLRAVTQERSEQEEGNRGPAPTPGSALTGLGGGAAKREPGLPHEEAHQSKSNVIVEESGEDDEQVHKGLGRLLKRKTSIAHVGRESAAEPASAAVCTTCDDAGVAAGSADAAVAAALVTDASGPIAGSALASAAVPPAADCHEPGVGSESEDALVAVSSVAAAGSASAAAGGDSSAAAFAAATEGVVAALSVRSSSEDDAAQDTRGSDSVGTARWQAAATGASGLASACTAGVVVAVGVGEESPGGSTSGRSPGKILGSSFHEDADDHPMRPADFSLAPGDVEPDTYFEGLDQLDGKPRAEGLQVVGDAEVVLPALCALKEIFDLYRDEAISKEELHILKAVLFRDMGVDLTRLEV
mmetsp:Transcript_141466/g.452200  ORF Transcript_141466/g.452200 Transcript_141466/m.452200 type:complete len:579 (-) Transcript_141466:457-2193(-)